MTPFICSALTGIVSRPNTGHLANRPIIIRTSIKTEKPHTVRSKSQPDMRIFSTIL